MTTAAAAPPTTYDHAFFQRFREGSLASARAVVPHVLELVPARSVVDFGCGLGTWLAAFREHGVDAILGLDGDYVDRRSLLIEDAHFRVSDLRGPIHLDRAYDLAVCLEVAEHLPASCAKTLVQSLTKAAPVVLFSAALPGQGGIDHRNEQWPVYWEQLFAEQGYRKHDVIRPLICFDSHVETWYRHNLYFFAEQSLTQFDGLPSFEPELMLVPATVLGRMTHWWSRPATRAWLALGRWRVRMGQATRRLRSQVRRGTGAE